ncbi:MAG: hypothetical protein ABIO04_12855 [Ferruginibacter sp.]
MSKEKYITSTCIISQQAIYKNDTLLYQNTGTASEFLVAAYRHFEVQYPKFFKMDNLCKAGFLAAEILLKDTSVTNYPLPEVGVVLANSNSSLDTDIKYFETTKDFASPALFVYTLPNIVIGEICIRHHLKGENAFFITETFDIPFIQQYVSNLFNNNILQACICGWVELLKDEYKTVLFLVENIAAEPALPFTNENIYKTYKVDNG